MKKNVFIIGSLIFFFIFTIPVAAFGGKKGQGGGHPELLEVAKDKLKEKTLKSGTLDIFDDEREQVRNLRIIKMQGTVIEKNGKYLALADYRDVNTGEIVTVEIVMISGKKDFLIEELRIKDIKPMNDGEAQEAREYTDSEIQDFMREYLRKQGQFSDGKVMVFDKDAEKMRNLKLTELKQEVRRMGVFYNSSSKFTDVDTGDLLDIDIALENVNGKLSVQALRIRNVRKGASQKK